MAHFYSLDKEKEWEVAENISLRRGRETTSKYKPCFLDKGCGVSLRCGVALRCGVTPGCGVSPGCGVALGCGVTPGCGVALGCGVPHEVLAELSQGAA